MPEVAAVFLRWMGMRAVVHRGYWLVASLYLVVDAHLSPFQLVFLGTAQGIISLVAEVPAGVVADTISRKWALVIAQTLIGTSMVITGLVTAFPALVATQMLWGVGWTFVSGADVAWVTDELDRPDRIAWVLTARALGADRGRRRPGWVRPPRAGHWPGHRDGGRRRRDGRARPVRRGTVH